MNLTRQQQDALTELINIAFSRTAAALSELTGHRVLLDQPQVTLCPITDLTGHLNSLAKGEVATVHQIFSGPVSGDALLILNYEGALALSDLLTGGRVPTPQLDASDREVLTEVGNILLNACLGMFGNLLKVHVTFSVPQLRLAAVHALLNSLVIGQDELRYALVVYTNFRIRNSAVAGYLMIVLGVASLDRLLAEVDRMAL
ncbi:MAG: chemotaxis protein CheC [Anaerolineae bacterium]